MGNQGVPPEDHPQVPIPPPPPQWPATGLDQGVTPRSESPHAPGAGKRPNPFLLATVTLIIGLAVGARSAMLLTASSRPKASSGSPSAARPASSASASDVPLPYTLLPPEQVSHVQIVMPSSVSGFKQIDSAEHAAYQKEIQDKGTAAGVNERIAYYGAGTTTAFYAGAGDRFTTQTALQVLQATARDWSSDPKTVSAIGIGQTRMTADGDAQFACAPVTGSYPGGYCVWVDSQTFGWVRAYAANDPLSIAKLLRTEVIAG